MLLQSHHTLQTEPLFCLLEGGQEKEALNGIIPLKSLQPKILD